MRIISTKKSLKSVLINLNILNFLASDNTYGEGGFSEWKTTGSIFKQTKTNVMKEKFFKKS